MDLITFVGWTLLFWGAYKLGVYVERKMQEKARAQLDTLTEKVEAKVSGSGSEEVQASESEFSAETSSFNSESSDAQSTSDWQNPSVH